MRTGGKHEVYTEVLSFTDINEIAMAQGHCIVECPHTINQNVVYWLDNKRKALYTLNELKSLLLH